MINVLDPQKHVKAELSKTYEVTNKKVRIGETGILLDKLKIESAGEPGTVYEAEEDYVASFNGEVPGATSRDCGNYSFMDLAEAKRNARRYLDEVLNCITDENLSYPR